MQLEAYQQAVIQTAQGIKDANLIDAATLEKIKTLNFEADAVRAKIKILTTALANVKITGDNKQDLLNLLQQLNAASSPFNPYAAPTAGVLTIISLILGALAKQKASQAAAAEAESTAAQIQAGGLKVEADQNAKALDEVVTGNEIFLKKSPASWGDFKEAHDAIQTAATVQKVSTIKAL